MGYDSLIHYKNRVQLKIWASILESIIFSLWSYNKKVGTIQARQEFSFVSTVTDFEINAIVTLVLNKILSNIEPNGKAYNKSGKLESLKDLDTSCFRNAFMGTPSWVRR